MEKQKTIAKEVSLNGTGLHTANKVTLVFKPAPVDTGIIFIRTDLAGKPQVKVTPENLLPQPRLLRRTSIGKDSVEIHTIEHLLAALVGLGIDNLYIEVSNNEVPGLDGSSIKFADLLSHTGIVEQDKEKQYFVVKEPIIVEEEGASLALFPSEEYRISYTLKYKHSFLGTGFFEITVNPDNFKKELASARTFCLEEEAAELQKQGVGLGANYENTLVVGKSGVIKNQLRYPDEFARHKALDLLGDLYVLGQPIKGHVIALRSGHSLSFKLLKKIQARKEQKATKGIDPNRYIPEGESLDINAIMKILPHREPFLFVDRITSLEKGKRAVGLKNVTINDYFFRGHFPGRPVMPGVIIIEAMAQVGGVMMLALEENKGKLAFFMAVDNAKFRKVVVPGDQVIFEVVAGKMKSRTGQVHGQAFVDGKLVAEADLMFAIIEG